MNWNYRNNSESCSHIGHIQIGISRKKLHNYTLAARIPTSRCRRDWNHVKFILPKYVCINMFASLYNRHIQFASIRKFTIAHFFVGSCTIWYPLGIAFSCNWLCLNYSLLFLNHVSKLGLWSIWKYTP